MGKIIVSKDIISVANAEITAQSTASSFAKVNVMDFWHLKRRWRMDSLTKSSINPVIYFDLGSAKTIDSIILNDVNFDKVVILGHASNLSTDWTAASFSSGEISISKDAQIDRYKVYIPLTSFNYRWLAICVPSAASAVGSYTTKWEIGTVLPLDSIHTFTHNMSPEYRRGAQRAYGDIELKSGHVERVEFGEIRWTATLSFGNRTVTEEVDLTTMNNMNISEPFIFYENNSDISKVYLCLRNSDYSGTMVANNAVTGTSIQLLEMV